MKILALLLLVMGIVVPCATSGSRADEMQTAPFDAADQNSEVARIDGRAIHFHDLNYDPESRYNLELHTMKVRLYREQKAVLQQYLDRMLLDKEALARHMITDELIAMISVQAEETAKTFEDDKELLFREFVTKMQRGFPSFSKMTTMPGPIEGLSLPSIGAGTPFIDEVKNQVVEMHKAAYVNDTKKTFIEKLRAQSKIEMFLERPELLRLNIPHGDDPWLGNNNAPITIQAFIDFQCPYCKKANATLQELLSKKKERIQIFARDFPLPSHRDAAMAACAAACADDQGRYWDYHNLLFDKQQKLDVMSLREYAAEAGLDIIQFDRCLKEGSGKVQVEKDIAAAALAGINSTPGILINGFYLSGSPSLDYLEEVIADIEKGRTPLIEDRLSYECGRSSF